MTKVRYYIAAFTLLVFIGIATAQATAQSTASTFIGDKILAPGERMNVVCRPGDIVVRDFGDWASVECNAVATMTPTPRPTNTRTGRH